jgi:hypothetical protein
MRTHAVLAGIALFLGGCASAPPDKSDDAYFAELISGGRLKGAALDKALKAAESAPLGSEQNPVRADTPIGQHAYLLRLRCSNGKAPDFERSGSLGPGAFGSIVDAYTVTCPGSEPASTRIIMDMYFPGYVELKPVAGFTIAPP